MRLLRSEEVTRRLALSAARPRPPLVRRPARADWRPRTRERVAGDPRRVGLTGDSGNWRVIRKRGRAHRGTTSEENANGQAGRCHRGPQLGVRVEFRATSESTAGEYTEVDVVGRAKGFITVSHVHVGVTEHHTVIEGSMKVKLHGKVHTLDAGRRDHDPAGHAALPEARRRRRRADPHPPDAERAQRRVLRAPGQARLQPLRLSQARLRREVRPGPGRGGPRRPPLASRPSSGSRRRCRERVRRSSTSGTSPPRPRTSSTRSPTPTPTPSGGSRSTSTSATTASTRHQHFKGRLPYHLHTRTRTVSASGRTSSRARPTATCAAPASGR